MTAHSESLNAKLMARGAGCSHGMAWHGGAVRASCHGACVCFSAPFSLQATLLVRASSEKLQFLFEERCPPTTRIMNYNMMTCGGFHLFRVRGQRRARGELATRMPRRGRPPGSPRLESPSSGAADNNAPPARTDPAPSMCRMLCAKPAKPSARCRGQHLHTRLKSTLNCTVKHKNIKKCEQ